MKTLLETYTSIHNTFFLRFSQFSLYCTFLIPIGRILVLSWPTKVFGICNPSFRRLFLNGVIFVFWRVGINSSHQVSFQSVLMTDSWTDRQPDRSGLPRSVFWLFKNIIYCQNPFLPIITYFNKHFQYFCFSVCPFSFGKAKELNVVVKLFRN